MPSKSRRKRDKHSIQSKKKGGPSRLSVPAQQPAATQTHEPVSSPDVSAPSIRVAVPKTKPIAVRYPYIATELRTIGILAGIMLVVLVVLALVLS